MSHFWKQLLPALVLASAATAADSEPTVATPAAAPVPAAPPAVTPAATAKPGAPAGPQKRLELDFGKLNFTPARDPMDVKLQQPRYADQVPPQIKAYDGKPISITGFMMPIKVKNGKTTEFVLFGNQASCCYGAPPQFCEFIFVKAQGEGVPAQQDIPVTLEGVLHIGDVYQENFWLQLYTLDCTGLK